MSYALLREDWPVARNDHRCIWCGETIPTGERHCYESSILDGRFLTGRWHRECLDDARGAARNEGGDFEFTPYENERPTANGKESP